MEQDLNNLGAELGQARTELVELRQFPGAPREFWPRFLAAAAKLASADIVVLLARQGGPQRPWAKLGEWTASTSPSRVRTSFTSQLERIAERGLREQLFVEQDDEAAGSFTLGIRLKLARAEEEIVLAAQVLDFTEAAARESLMRLSLAADTPSLYQAGQAARQAARDVEKFAGVLDLLVPVQEAERFLAAALALCNDVATRFHCDRVSLGWLEGGYVQLRAISRTERFDRRMAAAQAMEAVMEECLDQNEEILWPSPAGNSAVTRAHEKYAAEQKVAQLCSIPLRQEGKCEAVLTCERREPAFSEAELQQLRLSGDLVVRRLADLRRQDRWFGARWKDAARVRVAGWLGPEHTWRKVLALGGTALVAALFLVRVNYRVEGTFILRSDEASYLTAPFDGYIEQVLVRTGDRLAKGAPLLALNRSELLLEQSSAQADLTRYQRESEKARAARNLAEMRIDEALAQQAQARLDLVRYRLDNAVIKAPFDGVVVEGDLRERIAAPVKQGEALYKLARLDTLYAEAEIQERDVKEILGRSVGELAFVTQPRTKYAAVVQTVQSAAITRKEGNVFLVRLKPERNPEAWWRPGMTGLCKLSVEKRTLFWILTHRTVDFLRMKLWF